MKGARDILAGRMEAEARDSVESGGGEPGASEPGPGDQGDTGGAEPGPAAQGDTRGAEVQADAGEAEPGPAVQADAGEAEPGPAVQADAEGSGAGQLLPADLDISAGSEGEAALQAEGSKRLKLFSAAMETTVEKLLEAASFDRFAECFKPVYKVQPQFTHSVYKQLISQLQTSIQEEVNQISEDGLFERALPKLDQLERESEARSEPAWRPTGCPAVDLQKHLVPYLLQQRDYLRLKLKRAKEENAALAQSVIQGRNRVEALGRLRDERCQRWQECTELCRQFQLDEQ
ncbi:polyamine-modulated factor 1 [Carcharodon carcharias]|uniref:polyamine-modulated factor 1 n=1 Tax=Carcharodon carcharias TaxID=13397 RepID=UPI001B7EB55A|nr:polyamine-modulated factor 1 [Carcharodon carcharias]